MHGKLRRILLELRGFLVSSPSILPVMILSEVFLCSASHLLIENVFTAPHCTQKQSSFLNTTYKSVVCSSPSCWGGTGDEEGISSPPTNPRIHAKQQGYVWEHVPILQRHIVSASGGSAGAGVKSELMGEGNMCPLFPALRLPTTSLLYELLQPNWFLIFF